MARKWDYESVKHFIEVESGTGCKLLSKSYTNTETKMDIKCACGNEFECTLANFRKKRKKTCQDCVIETDKKRKTKTHEQFLKDVFKVHGDDVLVLGEYVKAHEKILVKYISCGHERLMFPNSIVRGSKCKDCARRRGYDKRLKTHEEFVKQVTEIHGDDYEVLGTYKGVGKSVTIKHVSCGSTYQTTPTSILSGSGCNICAMKEVGKKKRKSHEAFSRQVYEIYGEDYKLTSEYITKKIKVTIMHVECENEIEILPDRLLVGSHVCLKCIGLTSRKTHEEFIQEVYRDVGEEYFVLGRYEKNNIRILFKHNKCGNEYMATPAAFSKGVRCPKCQLEALAKPPEQFAKEVEDLVGDEYTLLSNYEKSTIKVMMRHNKCKHEYEVNPNEFLSGTRCPSCNGSRGEAKIMKMLKDNSIDFQIQAKFEGCFNKLQLPYDFFVEKSILIEYDGIGHFEPTDFAGRGLEWAIENMLYTQNNDRIKNNYCIKNEIIFIRIPYWEFNNVEDILLEILDINKHSTKVNYESKYNKYIVGANWNHDDYIASNPKNKEAV